MDYIEFSKKRKQQAEIILKKTNILDKLKKLGKLKQVGSYSLDLMVKPDIDLVIKVKKYLDIKKTIKEILKIAKNINNIKLKKIVDRRSLGLKGKSIHFEYYDKDIWGIDILVTTKDFKVYNKLKNKITEKITAKKKKDILKLKYYFYKLRKEKIKNTSHPIYMAVLNDKFRNTKAIIKSLETKS